MIKYINGNVTVEILEDGTKIRQYEDLPEIVHPESIDIKISDYCTLGCKFCHESSTPSGKHGDITKLISIIDCLPSGVELAIGGGNPLDHPKLLDLLVYCNKKGLIVNLTVNQGHLGLYRDLLSYIISEDLIKGLGISITSNNFKEVEFIKYKHTVFHLIAGINEIEIIDKLKTISDNPKILVLGYKQFGFGIKYYSKEVEDNIRRWYMYLPKYFGECVISFDNLGIEQLNVKRFFTKKGWDTFYMGDDFTYTMYIDAVKQEYAPTSRSSTRTKFDLYTLLEYFQKFKGVVPNP